MRGSGHILLPSSYTEEIRSEQEKYWHKAMQEDFASTDESTVAKLATLPTDGKDFTVRWKFDMKVNLDDVITQLKARLLGKSFMQIEGVDYSEVPSLVSKYSTE